MNWFGKRILSIAGLSLLIAALSPAWSAQPASDEPLLTQGDPEGLGQYFLDKRAWKNLDELLNSLATRNDRTEDGRFVLSMVAAGISEWFGLWDQDRDEEMVARINDYASKFPKSPFPAILASQQMHASAWRARGSGFSSTVTEEGWQLFRERNLKAWKILQAAKKQSSTVPTWYEEAIEVGLDANIPEEQVTALFNEGIRRFPGYYSLYFTYARQFSPRWGGTYEEADRFIKEQVAAKTNPDGEVLYTRLYWLIDQFSGGTREFFSESLVDWPRMRAGFEIMLEQYPQSVWNRANLLAFACRAGDSASYLKWRKAVTVPEFRSAAPRGLSLEICDTRFIKRA